MPPGFKEVTWLRGGELGEPQMPDQDAQGSALPVLRSPSLQPFQGLCWGYLPSCGGSSKGWNACSGQVTSASWAGFLIEPDAHGRLCVWEGVMGTEHGPPPSPGFMVYHLAGLPPSHCPPAGTLGAHTACLGLGDAALLSFQGCERVLQSPSSCSIKHQSARDSDGACGREVLPTSTWVLQGEMPAPCRLLEPCLGARDAEVLPGARHIALRTHGPPQTPQCMVSPAEVATGNAPTLAVCLCPVCPGPQSCPWTLRWALGGGPVSPCHLDAGGKVWEDSKDGVG